MRCSGLEDIQCGRLIQSVGSWALWGEGQSPEGPPFRLLRGKVWGFEMPPPSLARTWELPWGGEWCALRPLLMREAGDRCTGAALTWGSGASRGHAFAWGLSPSSSLPG